MVRHLFPPKSLLLAIALCAAASVVAQSDDYYRVTTYDLPAGLNLEASGIAVMPDGRLAVGIRKGEVWILEHPLAEPATAERVGFQRFASGMHEVLGLAWHDGALYATQRSEVTRLRDIDGDGVADEYLAVAKGWGVSGNYHEYAYGPVFDREGNMYNTLNASLGQKWPGAGPEAETTLWRGWCVMTPPGGKTQPFACGFRSPSGIGLNGVGDVFVTDQQGNWWGTNPLLHVRKGAFFGHADSLGDAKRPNSPVKHPGKLPDGITVAEAIHRVPGYQPPAVWFPYVKMGQSPTGLSCDLTSGKFGPFQEQLFVGEFVLSGVNRVFLEKIGGEYQGACFPFMKGLQSAVLSVQFLPDGSLVTGQTNRGWNSYGTKGFGLQRLTWTGKVPLEVLKLEAIPDGFRFTFTKSINPKSFGEESVIRAQSYTYIYTAKYGSPEVDPQPVTIVDRKLSQDGRTLELHCEGLRAGFVHEFELPALVAQDGSPLWHRDAYYSLIRLPAK